MERRQRNKIDNRGFSLVELLVVMAIAGVVTILVAGLMINGSQWYTAETAKADLQNDVQNINTRLQKTLQEAMVYDVRSEDGVFYILTGELDGSNNWTATSNPNDTAKAVMIYKNHIYIADTYHSPAEVKYADEHEDSDLRGYEISEYLKDGTFSATIQNEVQDVSGSAMKVVNGPINVGIAYTLEKNNKTTRSSYTIALRNSQVIDKIYDYKGVSRVAIEVK